MTISNTRQCPQCEAVIAVQAGYPVWCDQCTWNLQPRQAEPPRNIFETLYASIGRKHGQALFNKGDLHKRTFYY
jgi:hypothetical protein